MDKIDTNFDGLSKSEILNKYRKSIDEICNYANRKSITGVEFNFLLENHVFREYHQSYLEYMFVIVWKQRWKRLLILLGAIMLIVAIVRYKSDISSIFMKNIQNFIYPGMSLWRKLTLPVLKSFPALSTLYDETCLISNPFFEIRDIDCTPCMDVVNIMDLTNVMHHHGGNVPYIFKNNSTKTTLNTFHHLYAQYSNEFIRDAYVVQSTNADIVNLDDLFDDFLNRTDQPESHNLWHCNRMTPARLLRQRIQHPERLPRTGMSIERYIAIDTAIGPTYSIPDIDCSNVFIVQLMGTRTIVLRPTIECRNRCRTLSVRLQESYVLNYDWWYWKPISISDHEEPVPSMSYIGAHC